MSQKHRINVMRKYDDVEFYDCRNNYIGSCLYDKFVNALNTRQKSKFPSCCVIHEVNMILTEDFIDKLLKD